MNVDNEPLTANWLAKHVDISCVQASHTRKDIEALAEIAATNSFVSAHVLPNRLPELKQLLLGTGVLAGSPVGFPSGGGSSATKLAEADELLAAGVEELDIVANIGRLRSGEDSYVRDEVRRIVDVVAGRLPVRLILEVSRLDHDDIRRGCEIAIDAGVDYVKTGTGWAGPTTLEHVEVISAHVAGRIAVKAAGGIRTLEQVEAMRELGVTRFGINDAVAVDLVRQLNERAEEGNLR